MNQNRTLSTWLRKPVLFKSAFANDVALIFGTIIFTFGIPFFLTRGSDEPISNAELVTLESRLEALKPIQSCDTGNDRWLKLGERHVPADAAELRRMLEHGTPIDKHNLYLTNKYIDECQEKITDHFTDLQRKQEYLTKKAAEADVQRKALAK